MKRYHRGIRGSLLAISQKRLLQLFLGVAIPAAVGACFGLVAVMVFGAGQIAAIGWRNSLEVYGRIWLWVITIPAVLAGGGAILIQHIILPIEERHPRVASVLGRLWVIGFFGYGIVRMSIDSFRSTRDSHPSLAYPNSAAEIRAQLGKQSVAITKLSSDAHALLAHLDATANESAKARSQLLQTVMAIEKQRSALVQTEKLAGAIETQIVDTSHRLIQLRRLLGGEQPISKRDLDAAQRSGWWQGGLIGIITSIGASAIYRRLPTVRLRGRRKDASADSDPRDD